MMFIVYLIIVAVMVIVQLFIIKPKTLEQYLKENEDKDKDKIKSKRSKNNVIYLKNYKDQAR
ncbi:hypothetical protein OXPF_26850 [Oxobacter pfennigii]|uniref:Uncharacterized protein n=1 Tax=Oxobacter pfennigii TaxID=36849 RepID=A0A0P8W6Y6_9CLOT|nr:hypothetical protein [Oxobacter pfennigii]KPU43825.1 hypothetical protein OXPF_26850 [Oxobacter pfennigii]